MLLFSKLHRCTRLYLHAFRCTIWWRCVTDKIVVANRYFPVKERWGLFRARFFFLLYTIVPEGLSDPFLGRLNTKPSNGAERCYNRQLKYSELMGRSLFLTTEMTYRFPREYSNATKIVSSVITYRFRFVTMVSILVRTKRTVDVFTAAVRPGPDWPVKPVRGQKSKQPIPPTGYVARR